MKNQAAVVLSLAATSLAFPAFSGGGQDALEQMLHSKREAEADPALVSSLLSGLSSTITTLTSDVTSLLGSVASSVDESNLRPQAGYEFQEPLSTDSRGPCPGLNLLANYGYLPRNGLVSFSEVITATAEGFNMGADLATVLAVFAILTDGDYLTETWYLGSGPDEVGGLNRHSTVEADISPNREDYYLGCGNNHALSSSRFAANVKTVASSTSKQFDVNNMAEHYSANAALSKTNNPYLYFFPFPLIVATAAYPFYPNFFSNGTYGAGGVANYESISSIVGAKYDNETGNFEYVPERWPANWYRRSTEYGAVDAIVQGLETYAYNPVTPFFSQLDFGSSTANATTLLCDIYMGIQSITPLTLTGAEGETAEAITWALSKLDPYFGSTVLGCPSDSYSNILYPNGTGGPLSPPPAVLANAGNNAYNKTYFTAVPTAPACTPSAE